jgi:exodeoxyribonuclease V alpha subunit
MIGDIYQLPPVGAGYVLRDMIQSGVVPTEGLTIIKRQNEGLIINNCHAIKNGQDIQYENINEDGTDFIFQEQSDVEDIQSGIMSIIKVVLPAMIKDVDILRDIQVITPLREKTELGCKLLNIYLQDKLNPNEPVKINKNSYYSFRKGDKVIQTKNNYEKGIMNGDIGYVESIDKYTKSLKVQFESPDRIVQIPMYGKDNNLMMAYAITCHKYQGSENKIIIIPIHKCFGSLIMQRNWLYTAISRASELCILIGDKSQIPIIINRNFQIKRFTNLQEFLK